MDDAKEPQDVWPEGETALVTLFRHHLWSNLALIDACAALDEEQLSATAVGTYGPIYDTLRHIVASEEYYLLHLTEEPSAVRIREGERPSLAELRDHAQRVGERLMAVAASNRPGDLAIEVYQGNRWITPAGVVLTQVIHHATEHRTQILSILTHLGLATPPLSAWAFGDRYARPDSG